MGKTRPGIDRITKQRLQAEKAYERDEKDAHVKICATCHRAGTNIYMRCAEWWDIARSEHLAKRQLRGYDAPETGGMDTLPGLDI